MQEITGIFENKENLDRSFAALEKIGVKKKDINLLAREKEVMETLGKDYSSVYDINREDKMPRMKYISEKSFYSRENIIITVLFYFGISVALITSIIMHQSIGIDIAIAFFAGMLLQTIAMLVSGVFRKRHADYIERKLRKGGFIFWIKLDNDKDQQNKISRILKRFSAKKIRVINA